MKKSAAQMTQQEFKEELARINREAREVKSNRVGFRPQHARKRGDFYGKPLSRGKYDG